MKIQTKLICLALSLWTASLASAETPGEKYYKKTVAKVQKNLTGSPLDALPSQKRKFLTCGPESRELPEPIHRIAPQMPKKAVGKYSGRCNVLFDVSKQGLIENLQVTYCSKKIFAKPTIRSVLSWVYAPTCQAGNPARTNGVKASVSFEAVDKKGAVLPGSEAYPPAKKIQNVKELASLSVLYWYAADSDERINILAKYTDFDQRITERLKTKFPEIKTQALPKTAYGKLYVCMDKPVPRQQPIKLNKLRSRTLLKALLECKDDIISDL